MIEDEEASRYVAHVCLQCADPACLEVCPTGALSRDEERGCVVLDEGACTGCGLCVEACPFGGIFLVDGKAVKCEVCDAPLCVRACAAKALECVAWDAGEVEKQGRLYREVPL